MAIYGFGSTLDGEEFKDEFFNDEKIILGWNAENAQDLYSLVSRIKIGDIIYLKTNQPGGRTAKIKGIGVVTKGFLECFIDGDYNSADITEWNSLSIKVKWIRKKATPSAVSTEKTPNSQPTNTQKNEKERQKFMELSDKLGELSSWGFHNVATEIGSTAFPGAGLLTGLAMFCFNPVWWIVGPIFATIGSRRLVKGDYRGARKALWWGRGINWAIVFAVIVGSRLVINSPGDSRNSTRGDNQKENNTYRKESERSSARRKANRKIDIYVETTDTTIDTLCMAIEHFRTDVGRYPTAEEGGLRALVDDVGAPDWCGPYIKKLTTDAWNRPFFYGQSNGVPMLISAGPDGVFQTKDDIASRYEQYRVHPDFVPHDESRLLNPHKRITKEKQTDQESVERVWNGDSP